MPNLKKIPKFKTEDAERDWWAQNDSVDYLNWDKAELANFPNLKPSTKTISLRLPEDLLNQIKIEANKFDVPYQSFIKIILARSIRPPQPTKNKRKTKTK